MTNAGTDEPWNLVNAAWEAYDAGRSDEALQLLSRADQKDSACWATESEIRTGRGEYALAETALARATQLAGADDVAVIWARGLLCLETWRLAEAQLAFELLQRVEGSPQVMERLALIADLTGRPQEADRWLAQARALGAEAAPSRLSPREFESVVGDAVRLLPEQFQAVLESVAVLIEPVPRPPLPHGPGLLGLFTGRSLLHADSMAAGELPPTIRLYQRNLERVCRDRGQLLEQIRITLYHELGHALGFDEHGVHKMGLG